MALKEYTRKYFWGNCRRLIEKIVPEASYLYKLLYLNAFRIQSANRNKRQEKFVFQVHIVDSCNLNCVGCSTFAPLCNDSFVDVSSYEQDIKQMVALGEVEKITLIGGEPLLHPKIIEILEVSRKYIQTGELLLYTNGTLLLNQNPAFWMCCRDNNIRISVTPYPIKLDYERIAEVAKQYSVDVTYSCVETKNTFVKIPLNIEGKGNINKNFSKCSSSPCVALREGKIYSCYKPSLAIWVNNHFGYDFKVSEKDYLDIYKVKDKDEILDFICKPMPFCRYCDLDSMQFGIKWGISRKKIEEWM